MPTIQCAVDASLNRQRVCLLIMVVMLFDNFRRGAASHHQSSQDDYYAPKRDKVRPYTDGLPVNFDFLHIVVC
jgi:hypothetical protein